MPPREARARLTRRNARRQHNDGRLDLTIRLGQSLCGRIAVNIRCLAHNASGTFTQLTVGRAKINHEVAIGMPCRDHGCRGDHVQNELLRRPRFHARRACHHLGTSVRSDDKLRHAGYCSLPVANKRRRIRPALFSPPKRSDDVRRASTSRDTEDDIMGANVKSIDVTRPRVHIVLCSLH